MEKAAFIVKRIKILLKEGGISLLMWRIFLKLIRTFSSRIGDTLEEKMSFYQNHRYWPRLSIPRSFNETILHRMRVNPHPLSATVADKWKVRDYVAKRVGKDILNEVLWVGNSPENIPFENLPEQFVVKANHGSGWNIIVKTKHGLDKQRVIETCTKWLETKYSDYWGETYYGEIEPLIMIEKFLIDEQHALPLDYKFFCFHGEPMHIGVDIDRYQNHKRLFYDQEWNELEFTFKYPKANGAIKKPKMLAEMIQIARELSQDFDFCRVDLYCLNEQKIYFGEITLTPGAAQDSIKPVDWDFKLGALWNVQKNRNLLDLGVNDND